MSTGSAIDRVLKFVAGRREFVVLVAALVPVVAAWVFVELADEVVEGETQTVDERVLRALRNPQDPADALGPVWVEEAFRDIAALGSVMVLALVVLAVLGYLALQRQYRAALFLVAATLGGLVLNSGLKTLIDRPRPDVVPHLAPVHTASFPSGHSMLSAVVYLTLGALLAQMMEGRLMKLYFVVVALVLSFLVGVSRVYIGVHYPSDVLAGWTAGLAWASLCWLVARYLQRRGAVERPEE